VDSWIKLTERINNVSNPRLENSGSINRWCGTLKRPKLSALSERFIEGKISKSKNTGLKQAHELLGENLPLPPSLSSNLHTSPSEERESTTFIIPSEAESQSPFIKGT
jgi:hypothetical protein